AAGRGRRRGPAPQQPRPRDQKAPDDARSGSVPPFASPRARWDGPPEVGRWITATRQPAGRPGAGQGPGRRVPSTASARTGRPAAARPALTSATESWPKWKTLAARTASAPAWAAA